MFVHILPLKDEWGNVFLTLRTILLSDDGVLPVHNANLQWSPSICSVMPRSVVCTTQKGKNLHTNDEIIQLNDIHVVEAEINTQKGL